MAASMKSLMMRKFWHSEADIFYVGDIYEHRGEKANAIVDIAANIYWKIFIKRPV